MQKVAGVAEQDRQLGTMVAQGRQVDELKVRN